MEILAREYSTMNKLFNYSKETDIMQPFKRTYVIAANFSQENAQKKPSILYGAYAQLTLYFECSHL